MRSQYLNPSLKPLCFTDDDLRIAQGMRKHRNTLQRRQKMHGKAVRIRFCAKRAKLCLEPFQKLTEQHGGVFCECVVFLVQLSAQRSNGTAAASQQLPAIDSHLDEAA